MNNNENNEQQTTQNYTTENTAVVTVYKLQSARYTTHYKKQIKLFSHMSRSRHVVLLALQLALCRIDGNELRVVSREVFRKTGSKTDAGCGTIVSRSA
jgi:hypothetical protein